MVAEQKIKEAEYFLDKITQAMTREDFVPNLSAFLSATRSIPDITKIRDEDEISKRRMHLDGVTIMALLSPSNALQPKPRIYWELLNRFPSRPNGRVIRRLSLDIFPVNHIAGV